jgi:hypothetical protein
VLRAAHLSLSALALLLPVGVIASPDAAPPRIYVVEPSPDRPDAYDGIWRPSGEEIERARSALVAYLAVAHPPAESGSERYRRGSFDTYILQFAGVRSGGEDHDYSTRGDGPKAILIKGMCSHPYRDDDRLTKGIVTIQDGGACYFTAVYDPMKNEIVRFAVNGVA